MPVKSVVKLIEGFKQAQEADGKSANTVKAYGRQLNAFARWLDESGGNLAEVTRHDVQSYIKSLESAGKAPTTIKGVFAALSVFARYIDRPATVENVRIPDVRPTRNIAPKSLEHKEYNRLLREVERDGNPRSIAIVYTLLYTGLRVSELVALDRNDLTIGERSGHVQVRNGKGGISRVVPLPAEARHHIRRYLDSRQDDNPALFLSNYRSRMTVRSVQRVLAKYGANPHALRHTYCRRLVKSGVDIATVAEVAGHADVNVTRRYAAPSPDEIEKAVEGAFV